SRSGGLRRSPWRATARWLPRSHFQLLTQEIVDDLGVRLAAGLLLSLVDEKPEQPFLAALVGGDLPGVGREDRFDHGIQLRGVGYGALLEVRSRGETLVRARGDCALKRLARQLLRRLGNLRELGQVRTGRDRLGYREVERLASGNTGSDESRVGRLAVGGDQGPGVVDTELLGALPDPIGRELGQLPAQPLGPAGRGPRCGASGARSGSGKYREPSASSLERCGVSLSVFGS